jgi:hypothetical protein
MRKIAQNDNPISRMVERYKSIVPNPLASSLLVGGGLWGVSKLGYGNIMNTIRSLGRPIAKRMTGMSDMDFDESMDELTYDSNYSTWLPIGVGALGAIAAAAPSFSRYRKNFGLTAWDSPIMPHKPMSNDPDYLRGINDLTAPEMPSSMTKPASYKMYKAASAFFNSTGYDNDPLDMTKAVDIGRARSLFDTDPYLMNDSYTRNFGNSIINNASIQSGVNNPTLGNIFDSAKDKVKSKLSIQGIADIGIKSMVANNTARLFTGVLDTMIDLSPTTRRNIIDTGTWAGTVSAILN